MHSMLNLSITFSFVDLKKRNTDSATSNNFRNECLEKPVKNSYSSNENCRREIQLLFLGLKKLYSSVDLLGCFCHDTVAQLAREVQYV